MAVIDGELDLSIIIVNWNSLEYLRGCIDSIRKTGNGISYEVIVVDNQSTDGSRRVLEGGEFPGIRVMLPGRNLGFVRANNLGASISIGKHLLFLNPDTLVFPDALKSMKQALDANQKLGIVGCRLLNRDLSLQTSCVQPLPTIANQILSIDLLRARFPNLPLWGIRVLYETDLDVIKPVPVVSGACLMIRRRLFEELGGFSRDYFMYAEEVDLCFGAAQRGWHVGYVGAATVVHYGGQSSSQAKKSSFADVLMANSIFTFLRKSRGLAYALLYRVCQIFSGALRLFVLGLAYAPLRAANAKRAPYVAGAIIKWIGITRWAIGLEVWANRLVVDADR